MGGGGKFGVVHLGQVLTEVPVTVGPLGDGDDRRLDAGVAEAQVEEFQVREEEAALVEVGCGRQLQVQVDVV
jgi:hypothetical protein